MLQFRSMALRPQSTPERLASSFPSPLFPSLPLTPPTLPKINSRSLSLTFLCRSRTLASSIALKLNDEEPEMKNK
ncbi:hypothetical protein Hanom_Chr14g01303191 [Helianthus anomalus]